MKLIQVTDLHFVPPGIRLLGLDPKERLKSCIDDINANHADAAHCLFTGDLADRGMPEAYAELREVLADLQLPHSLLIGNHDDRENFCAAFPDAERDGNGFVQRVLELPDGIALLLDTHEPGQGWGSYCALRCAWLSERLAEFDDRPVFIFMHHPPFKIGIPSLDRIRLLEAEGFEAAVKPAGNVRHIFFGHVHRPVSGSWHGIPYSALRATAHQVPLEFGERRRVPYSLEPPAYAVITIEPQQTTVHLHDYLDKSALPSDQERYSGVRLEESA